jgi:hypothetical protein
MYIGENELEIVERSLELRLETSVLYHTVPDQAFAGLVRSVITEITLINSDNDIKMLIMRMTIMMIKKTNKFNRIFILAAHWWVAARAGFTVYRR